MRKSMRVIGAFGALLVGLTVAPALAQPPAAPEASAAKAELMTNIQLTRLSISAQRQALITLGMDLTVEEMQGFWPLYREYRLEAAALGDRLSDLLVTYAENHSALTEEVADQLLAEATRIDTERASLRARYLPRFRQILPARKVMRFYQLENKLDIAILGELAQDIPLAR